MGNVMDFSSTAAPAALFPPHLPLQRLSVELTFWICRFHTRAICMCPGTVTTAFLLVPAALMVCLAVNRNS